MDKLGHYLSMAFICRGRALEDKERRSLCDEVLDQYVPPIHHAFQAIIDWHRSEDAVLPGGRRCQTRQKSAFNSPRATLSGHCQASLLPSRLLA
jgi:hypothetical protein